MQIQLETLTQTLRAYRERQARARDRHDTELAGLRSEARDGQRFHKLDGRQDAISYSH